MIEGALGTLFTGSQRRIQLAYSGASLELLGARVAVVKLIAFALAAGAMLALYLVMTRSRFGQALRATIQHPEAARLVGIPTERVVGYGFGLGLATAAIGGTALALDSTIYPSLHWHWIGPLMAIIVVGGLGSVGGAAAAALVLGLSQSLLQIELGTTWAQTVFYVALFVTLAVRPQGFFGGRLAAHPFDRVNPRRRTADSLERRDRRRVGGAGLLAHWAPAEEPVEGRGAPPAATTASMYRL